MGYVILVIRVLPSEPGVFEEMKKKLEALKPKRVEEEPVAFGLKALKLTFIVPDEGGHQDELENKIRATDGVGDMEIIHASRSL
jgi:elongation factor 1-beta